ncbi:hypothetical protein L3X38_009407 [Prunus dulcis]|uniref:Reverse transcriptase/retrotransposon-derived protein RNase H-like domain-containing protein n=1 Tax=Prunus dulcis TaxID=3755 RepID=A0AAD4WFR1_PRUDU|nr:hypothetical protein L3X38_009407 [Prunus dulcis]
MKQFMQSQTATNPKNAQYIGEIKSTLSKLTSSLSIQEKGKFPSQVQPNPHAQLEVTTPSSSSLNENKHEHVKAVTTLRSGKLIGKVYKQLGLGELKPTSVTLQLTDHSVKIPRGIVEDVLVQVQEHNGWVPKYEELPTVSDETKSSREEAPRCELKPLPARLKYAFMGEEMRLILWPLNNLLEKDAKFDWNSAYQEAFEKLIKMLTSTPIMQPPDWSMPFEIMCDASDGAIGAVLGQRKDKKPVVICYASRTLNSAQKSYTATEKELLAVVFPLEKFRSYILGSQIIVFTDHSAKKEAK